MGRIVRGAVGLVRRGFRFVDRMTGGLLGKGLKLVGKVAKFALPIIGLAAPFILPGVGGALTGLLSKFGGAGGIFGKLAGMGGGLLGKVGTSLGGLGSRIGGAFTNIFGQGATSSLRGLCSQGMNFGRQGLSHLNSFGNNFNSCSQTAQAGPNTGMNWMNGLMLAQMGMQTLPMLAMAGGGGMGMY